MRRGTFYCPQCEGDRHFSWKSARRWFTLFFVPVLPLNHLGEYVECDTCESTYDTRVLNIPTKSELESNFDRAVRHLLVGLVRADSRIEQPEREIAVLLGRRMVGEHYDASTFEEDLESISDTDLFPSISSFAGILNEHAKVMLLQTATLLSAADGEIHDKEVSLILDIAHALAVQRSYVQGIMSDALTPATDDDLQSNDT